MPVALHGACIAALSLVVLHCPTISGAGKPLNLQNELCATKTLRLRGSPMSRSLLSVLLALTLSLSCVSFAFAQQDLLTLNNADIITMVRAKLPTALIIEKINTSSCN